VNLMFIGEEMNSRYKEIEAELDKCLLTEEEMNTLFKSDLIFPLEKDPFE